MKKDDETKVSSSAEAPPAEERGAAAGAGSSGTGDRRRSIADRDAHRFTVTLFDNLAARTARTKNVSLLELHDLVLGPDAPTKKELPLLSGRRYGDQRSGSGSLRHDGNVVGVTLIELDDDVGTLGVEGTVMRLQRAGVRSLVYTSPSYSQERFKLRILAPTSRDAPAAEHGRLIARLNGVVGGQASVESFTLSQSYYYGRVAGNPAHRAAIVDGEFIDLLDQLDDRAIGKPEEKAKPKVDDKRAAGFKTKLALIGDGPGQEGFHETIGAAAASYVATYGKDCDRDGLKALLRKAIEDAPKKAGRDEDIRKYLSDRYLDPVIESAVRKGFGDRKRDDDGGSVVLRSGADITPEPIRWLWRYWLALGAFHLLAGDPGVGKSTIAMAIAAIVTRGLKWPDGTQCEARDVVIYSGEDSIERTLLPRFLAAGGDPKRVRFVTGREVRGKLVPFDPSTDMPALIEAASGLDVGLVIIDPVVLAVPGDSHKNAEVRRGLQPVADVGTALDCAVLGITHLSKGTKGRDPLERINGSVAFGALARGTMAAVRPADQDDPRLLVRAKYNDGPDGGGFEYRLHQEPLPDRPDIIAQRPVWGDALDGSARELVNDAEKDDRVSKVDMAEMWLQESLSRGPMPSSDLEKAAGEAGIAERTLKRAKKNMGVVSEPLAGAGKNAPWYCRLREQAAPTAAGLFDEQGGGR
jgi:energy-coupling factor transporter ATP-binding protein EcfA2